MVEGLTASFAIADIAPVIATLLVPVGGLAIAYKLAPKLVTKTIKLVMRST